MYKSLNNEKIKEVCKQFNRGLKIEKEEEYSDRDYSFKQIFVYNERGLLIRKEGKTYKTIIQYDKNDNKTKTIVTNKKTQKIFNSTDYKYNDKNQLIQTFRKNHINSSILEINFEYDENGNNVKEIVHGISQTNSSSNYTIEYIMKYEGNKITRTNTSTNESHSVEFNEDGQFIRKVLADGTETLYEYNSDYTKGIISNNKPVKIFTPVLEYTKKVVSKKYDEYGLLCEKFEKYDDNHIIITKYKNTLL